MNKIALLVLSIIFLSFSSFAQDDSGDSDRNIFVAYSPSTSAIIGLQGGMLSNGDGIIGGDGFIDPLGFYLAARFNNKEIMNYDRLSVTLGVAPQLTSILYFYAGGGYGTYKYYFHEPTIQAPQEIKGFEADGGILLKIWKVTLSGGVSILDFNQTDYTVGIGYTF